MYLIIEHDFDSSNNNVEEARLKSIVGCTDGEVEAVHWIANKMRNTKQYKGYDGVIYPWYEKIYIEKLEINLA